MQLIQKVVFVVLKRTRGSSEPIAVFNELDHANKFIEKFCEQTKGTYCQQAAVLYDFAPSEGEII